jgi:hypothetical protein
MNDKPESSNEENPKSDQGEFNLRDYFAAKAMQGLLGSLGEWTASTPNMPFADTVAIDAYWIADAMLEARQEEREDD